MFNVVFFGADGTSVHHQTLPARSEDEAMDQAMFAWREYRALTGAVMFHLYRDDAADPFSSGPEP